MLVSGVFGLFFSHIIVHYTYAIKQDNCPIGCLCENVSVKCSDGYWNELPSLPMGIQKLTITGGKFDTLRKPILCGDYINVTYIDR